MKKRINIAIDGYSSTGKSTVARQLAQRLQYRYIDTGAMYRAVTLWALQQGWIQDEGISEKLTAQLPQLELDFSLSANADTAEITLNGSAPGEDLRSMAVANKVSTVASIPAVRRYLVRAQQKIAAQKGVVMDGRDIGTVVIPDAEVKIFMTAKPEIRAQRRYRELQSKGHNEVSLTEVAANIEKRDYEDTHRAESPLRQASDAKILDNSNLDMEEQLKIVLQWVGEIMSRQ